MAGPLLVLIIVGYVLISGFVGGLICDPFDTDLIDRTGWGLLWPALLIGLIGCFIVLGPAWLGSKIRERFKKK